jgi:hypothetical protein
MRHKSRTIFAALVAVLALGAIASASASAALPEFVPGEGAKWPITFQDAAGARSSAIDSYNYSIAPHCEGSQVKGEITAAKVASVTLELTGCWYAGGHEFWTEGQKQGTIVLPGKGTLVYIDKAEKKVGILDELKATKLKVSPEGEGWKAEIAGKLVIPITPLNTSTTKFALPIHSSSKNADIQEYRSYGSLNGRNKRSDRRQRAYDQRLGRAQILRRASVHAEQGPDAEQSRM